MSRDALRLERLERLEAALRGDPGHDVTGAVVKPTHDRTKAVWNWERMGRALLALTGPFEAGTCRVCGCTETTACTVETIENDDGLIRGVRACGWVEDTAETLCDAPLCVAAAYAAGVLSPEGQLLTGTRPDRVIVDDLDETPTACECDNTHEANDTVCRYCWNRGRRRWADPEPKTFAIERALAPPQHFHHFEIAGDYGSICDEFPGLSPGSGSR